MSSIVSILHDSLAAIAPIDGVSIGRRDDKSTWTISFKPEATKEARAAALAALQAFDPKRAAIVPVTALQARRALRAAGLYAAVKAAVDSASNPDVQDSWEYAILWHRDAPWIETLSRQLGMSPEQVDTLFIQAATYEQ